MKKTIVVSVMGAALAFGFAARVDAASFNCRYAKLPVEVAICQNSQLSYLDERMAAKYFKLKNRLPYYQWQQVRREQKSWIRDRNRCGYDSQCISGSYNWRIGALDRWLQGY